MKGLARFLKSKSETASALLLVFAILCLLFVWFLFSYFEARSYNRVTGEDVSTFDAMFVELRIVGNADRNE